MAMETLTFELWFHTKLTCSAVEPPGLWEGSACGGPAHRGGNRIWIDLLILFEPHYPQINVLVIRLHRLFDHDERIIDTGQSKMFGNMPMCVCMYGL